MGTFRFLHAADLHLDSPLRGLDEDPTAPAEIIRGATRKALGKLVDAASEHDAAFVVIAGDIYDGDWPDYATGQFFLGQAAELVRRGKRLFLIQGNHDAQNQMTRSLRHPEGVTAFGPERATTELLHDLGVAIHGQSFSAREERRSLARDFPKRVAGFFNIGLLHTSADGHADHAAYAPCTVEELTALEYDYWALGHVHVRRELSRSPWIVYPGNIQGRHVNETGAKGATLVTVTDGRVTAAEHVVLDVFRWDRVRADLTGEEAEEGALDRIRDALAVVLRSAPAHLGVRVTLEGVTTLHGAMLADPGGWRQKVVNEANHLDARKLWIEAVRIETSGHAPASERSGAVGDLLRTLDALVAQPPADLMGAWPAAMLKKLPAVGLLDEGHPLRRAAAGDTAELLQRARALLLSRLD